MPGGSTSTGTSGLTKAAFFVAVSRGIRNVYTPKEPKEYIMGE